MRLALIPAIAALGLAALGGCSYDSSSNLAAPATITLRYPASDKAAAEQAAAHQCAFDGKKAAYKETATEQGASVLVFECR